jgi:hypothetical protein
VYRLPSRQATWQRHKRLLAAVSSSGGRLLFASDSDRAPVYLGIETLTRERVGVLVYPFTANQVLTNPICA